MPAFRIRALAVQIGGVTAQAVRLGDAPQFPTFPTKYPHKSPPDTVDKKPLDYTLSWISIQ